MAFAKHIENVGVFVPPPPEPPEPGVTLVSPEPGTTLSGTVEFRVFAYDPAGLTGVVFYALGVNIGTDFEGVDNVDHEYAVTLDTTTVDNGELTFSCDVYVVPGTLTYTLPQVTYTVSNLPPETTLPPPSYNLVFEDNFDSYDLVIDGAAHIVNGKWHDHVWYATYPPAGSQYVEDGILHLVSKRSDGYPQITMASFHPAALPQNAFKQGYFETLMRWTGGQGAWPAFWLNSASASVNPNYPDPPPGFPDPTVLAGELDILEVQGAQPNLFYGTLHRNTGGLWGVPDSTAPTLNAFTLPDNFNDEWHIISALWTETEVVWYFDRQEILRSASFDSTDQEMMLILQMEIGGWMGGADGTTPDEMHAEFDYVRVYQAP